MLDHQKEKQKREKACKRKRKQREKEKEREKENKTNNKQNSKTNIHFDFVSEEVFILTTKEFDALNERLTYQKCTSCRQVKLEMKLERRTFETDVHQLCSSCKYYSKTDIRQLQQSLPVWWDDDNHIQFQLPKELIDLREGEKLMIQKYSAYIPCKVLFFLCFVLLLDCWSEL